MLEKLRARELPQLYLQVKGLFTVSPEINHQYDKAMVQHIAKSSDKILNYFTEPFETNKNGNKSVYVFQFISKLLDMLIMNNSPFLKKALKKSIKYNEGTYKKLTAVIKQAVQTDCCYFDIAYWKHQFNFYKDGSFVGFRDINDRTAIGTNVINVTKKSKDSQINIDIEKLKHFYNLIRNIKMEEELWQRD